jgi:hypothetical protein
MHEKYADVFKNTPAMNVRLIVGNRNRRAATNDLIRKKPQKSLLTNKPGKSKHLLQKHRIKSLFKRTNHSHISYIERLRKTNKKPTIQPESIRAS